MHRNYINQNPTLTWNYIPQELFFQGQYITHPFLIIHILAQAHITPGMNFQKFLFNYEYFSSLKYFCEFPWFFNDKLQDILHSCTFHVELLCAFFNIVTWVFSPTHFSTPSTNIAENTRWESLFNSSRGVYGLSTNDRKIMKQGHTELSK